MRLNDWIHTDTWTMEQLVEMNIDVTERLKMKIANLQFQSPRGKDFRRTSSERFLASQKLAMFTAYKYCIILRKLILVLGSEGDFGNSGGYTKISDYLANYLRFFLFTKSNFFLLYRKWCKERIIGGVVWTLVAEENLPLRHSTITNTTGGTQLVMAFLLLLHHRLLRKSARRAKYCEIE